MEKGLDSIIKNNGLTEKILQQSLESSSNVPSPEIALSLTELGVPLHPKYTYDWSKITKEALIKLRNSLALVWPSSSPYLISINKENKETLETLLVPHNVVEGKIEFIEAAMILEKCLKLNKQDLDTDLEDTTEIVSNWAGFKNNKKAVVYVGARMGRPEKAKERRMSPYIHCLFPVGNAGGPQRDITKAKKGTKVKVEISKRICPECGHESKTEFCSNCSAYTIAELYCHRCKVPLESKVCHICRQKGVSYGLVEIDLREELESAIKFIGGFIPDRIKCVKSLMNDKRIPEHLAKGILRARYDLSVFKDGTLRFDLTNTPLTHFMPKEVGVNIEKLKELGYTCDMQGKELKFDNQMLELKVQDIVIPEKCGDYFIKVTNFIDDLLHDFYKLERYYNIKDRSQLIGKIVYGLAPHTSAAIVGRIIGWTTGRCCYAHPYWHAAKRRNCDGDEDALMMGLDPLLNFSLSYLPEQSGGLMDAPLFVIPNINPKEVDKEAHNLDVINRYPLEFYKMSVKRVSPYEFIPLVDTLGERLGTVSQLSGFNYTKNCSNLNLSNHLGAYTKLNTMLDKLDSQLDLTRKLRAVDSPSVALKILNSHFMKDIVGNLRAFTRQRFRCGKCNKKYRRPPLSGSCSRCGGKILMTVHKKGIEKYIKPAKMLVENYKLEKYYSDRLMLVQDEIDSIFKEEPSDKIMDSHKQFMLVDFIRPSSKKKEKRG
jgi:DNA polymerase II large subunit